MVVRELSNKLFSITLSSTICAYVPLNLQLNTFFYHVETCQYVMATDNVLKLNIHRSDLPCHHWELFLRTHYHIPLSHGSLWSLTAPVTCHFSKTIVSQLYVISFPHSTPAFVAYGGEILLLLCMLSGGTYWFAISIGKG